MKILSELIRRTVTRARPVETAKVLEVSAGRARLATARGEIWARCGVQVSVGSWVTFARIGSEYQVLAIARAPKSVTKTVRV